MTHHKAHIYIFFLYIYWNTLIYLNIYTNIYKYILKNMYYIFLTNSSLIKSLKLDFILD